MEGCWNRAGHCGAPGCRNFSRFLDSSLHDLPGVQKADLNSWSWRREWQPAPVFLPGKFHGQRSLEGYSPWGCRVRHEWATEHAIAQSGNREGRQRREGQPGNHEARQGPGSTARDTRSNVFELFKLSVCSCAQSCLTLCDPMDCSMPGLPVHHQGSDFTQTHIHWVSDDIQPSYLLSSPSPPTFNPSQHQGLFKWVSYTYHQSTGVSASYISPKYWSFSFNISPSNEHPGLISFRMDFLDLLVVQGTLKSLLQHHSSKASIFQCSAFFIVQLSHPYMTTGKP